MVIEESTNCVIANPDWNPWENDKNTFELYRKRCLKQAEEMTCAAQVAEILKSKIQPNETLLDAGCAGGYYFWSFKDRNISVDYHGLDYTPCMIDLAKNTLCEPGLVEPSKIKLGAIEYLNTSFDTIVCFNVLTNSPHYARGLEQLLKHAKKRIVIRESIWDKDLSIHYAPDPYLDEDKRHIKVYHNTYPKDEIIALMEEYGFQVTQYVDERTQDQMELVVDIPHYWKILCGEKNKS